MRKERVDLELIRKVAPWFCQQVIILVLQVVRIKGDMR